MNEITDYGLMTLLRDQAPWKKAHLALLSTLKRPALLTNRNIVASMPCAFQITKHGVIYPILDVTFSQIPTNRKVFQMAVITAARPGHSAMVVKSLAYLDHFRLPFFPFLTDAGKLTIAWGIPPTNFLYRPDEDMYRMARKIIREMETANAAR